MPRTVQDPQQPVSRRWPVLPVRRLVAGTLLICALAGMAVVLAAGAKEGVPVAGFEVVNVYPHDPHAFCQGLVYSNGLLYEGTGHYGASTLRHVELETGRVLKQFSLDRQFFGEGITLFGDALYQLTWRARRAFVFDRDTLEYRQTFEYRGEGWGLTHDGKHLILSDGSASLRFLDPATFQEVRKITVHEGRRRIDNLNELEFVDGEILANIWHSDMIARIDPSDGRLMGWIDLSTLWPLRLRPDREAVLNGIAYDETGKRLFVTGKNWPKLYEIRLVERP